jgi:hypothetical protein
VTPVRTANDPSERPTAVDGAERAMPKKISRPRAKRFSDSRRCWCSGDSSYGRCDAPPCGQGWHPNPARALLSGQGGKVRSSPLRTPGKAGSSALTTQGKARPSWLTSNSSRFDRNHLVQSFAARLPHLGFDDRIASQRWSRATVKALRSLRLSTAATTSGRSAREHTVIWFCRPAEHQGVGPR